VAGCTILRDGRSNPGDGAFLNAVLVTGFVGEFQYKEFISQAWFVVGVCGDPTLLVAVPFGVIIRSRSAASPSRSVPPRSSARNGLG